MGILGKVYYPDAPENEQGRVYFYDNLRFFLIAVVVVRHFLFRVHGDFTVVSGIILVFLTFLMPLFIFITGFYARGIFTKEGGFRIGRILLFVLLYVFLSFGIFLADFFIRDGRAVWEPLTMINAAWYLWACAVWFGLIPLLRRTPPIPTLVVTVVLSLGAGYVDAIYYDLSLSKIFTFLPFFAAGYYLSRVRMNRFLAIRARWRILAFFVVLILIVITVLYYEEIAFYVKRIVEAKDPYRIAWRGRGPAAAGAVWRLVWYGAVCGMSVCALLLIPRCRTFFTLFGARTLQIYFWHAILVRVFVPLGVFVWIDSFSEGMGQLIMTACALLLTFLLSARVFGLPFQLLERVTKNLTIRPRKKPPGVFLLLVLLVCFSAGFLSGCEAPARDGAVRYGEGEEIALVYPPCGTIRGVHKDGVNIYRGIPYAAPPVGDLRFAPPERAAPHEGILDCSRPGPSAMQKTAVGKLPMNEDCLSLNIWTSGGAGEGRPVYVFFHGGAFVHGSGAESRFEGSSFARDGVVYVTINYRLSVFGFYASPDTMRRYGTTGNWGLLDQICALRWVRENIDAFGGDPEKVTIGGHSAGAFSAGGLLISPSARGLFRSAILQSGTPLGLPALNLRCGGDLGRAMDVSRSLYPEALASLRAKDARELAGRVDYYSDFAHRESRFLTPVFDGRVLPADPRACLASGDFQPVNLLLGFTADEGSRFIPEDISGAEYRRILTSIYGRDRMAQVLEKYPVNPNGSLHQTARRVFSVACFSGGALQYADAFQSVGAGVYLYRFSYVSAEDKRTGLGARHGAELPYVFGNLSAFGVSDPTDREAALAEELHAAWVRFIKTGDPGWILWTAATQDAMDFGTRSQIKPPPELEDIRFLSSLTPLPSP